MSNLERQTPNVKLDLPLFPYPQLLELPVQVAPFQTHFLSCSADVPVIFSQAPCKELPFEMLPGLSIVSLILTLGTPGFRVNLALLKGCRDQILFETDCPYLSPDRERQSQPADVAITRAHTAALWGVSEQEVEKQVSDNFVRLFGVDP